MDKPKAWRMDVGMLVGALVGAVLWWSSYDADGGLMQKPQLILIPAAIGGLVVSTRNKRKKAGPYDPEVIARNRRGRI